MKSRSSFTASEIEMIRGLVRKKAKASRSNQKGIRAQIRDLGFYISDFSATGNSFTEADLDRLIRQRRIIVLGAVSEEDAPRQSWWNRLWGRILHRSPKA